MDVFSTGPEGHLAKNHVTNYSSIVIIIALVTVMFHYVKLVISDCRYGHLLMVEQTMSCSGSLWLWLGTPHGMYFPSTPLPLPPSLLLSEKDMVGWC